MMQGNFLVETEAQPVAVAPPVFPLGGKEYFCFYCEKRLGIDEVELQPNRSAACPECGAPVLDILADILNHGDHEHGGKASANPHFVLHNHDQTDKPRFMDENGAELLYCPGCKAHYHSVMDVYHGSNEETGQDVYRCACGRSLEFR